IMASLTEPESFENQDLRGAASQASIGPVILGHRLRHFRSASDMTLGALATQLCATASHLSMIDYLKREPQINLLTPALQLLGGELADLLQPEAPSTRAALEISVEKAQRTPHWQAMGLPTIRVSSAISTPVLEALDGLTRELRRQYAEQAATPEEARRANVSMRKE